MSTKASRREKRQHRRYPVGITMDIMARGQGDGGGRCRGTIADLSIGGMSFKSDAVLEQGMCLYLRLDRTLEIRGEVRHARGGESGFHRYGVRFHKVGRPIPGVQQPVGESA